MRFDAEHDDAERSALHSNLLLRTQEDGLRIMLYLNYQDLAALVAARIPSAANAA